MFFLLQCIIRVPAMNFGALMAYVSHHQVNVTSLQTVEMAQMRLDVVNTI